MEAGPGEEARTPGEQMAGEPHKGYGRFKVYLELGPTRTLFGTARVAGEQRKSQSLRPSGDWPRIARKWHWRERANAWDVHQRELLAISERNAP